MSWTPVVLQSIISIAAAVVMGLAVLGEVRRRTGQDRWRATQEWEALAEARKERIVSLEKELEFLRTQVSSLQVQLVELQKNTNGQLADMQKLNLDLQKQLQKALTPPKG